jgi:hypothetical protein
MPRAHPVGDYDGKSRVAQGDRQMTSFELVETGLTADKFVVKRSKQSLVAKPAAPGRPRALERTLSRNSFLLGDGGIADRLSVRGLNFVYALVEMNGGQAVDVRFLEIEPNDVAVEGWGRPNASLIHYHLICECSEQAHVRSGSKRRPLSAGDLLRVVHEYQPAIFHGGEAGSLIMAVPLKLPQASCEPANESPAHASAAESTPSSQATRRGAAS